MNDASQQELLNKILGNVQWIAILLTLFALGSCGSCVLAVGTGIIR